MMIMVAVCGHSSSDLPMYSYLNSLKRVPTSNIFVATEPTVNN